MAHFGIFTLGAQLLLLHRDGKLDKLGTFERGAESGAFADS